jgi:hypothetical protein
VCYAVDIYLSDPDIKIRKLIALKDIRYSNSPIEAANKILKYQELHLINIPNLTALIAALDKWIPVFNNERPNRKGGYLLTPYEIYNGKTIDKNEINSRYLIAKTERITQNRKAVCELC